MTQPEPPGDTLAPEDGNAVGGPLGDVFVRDVTLAVVRCGTCGREGSFAESDVWQHGPGVVLRCHACAAVLLRLVVGPHRTCLDASGLATLTWPAGDGT
ncbi:hypothetical protein Bcav_4093 [Beutenbergia cavernae DSM 12333]|uniref:Uncharacterized protein n=1 Tax=Beutenbergia cavernae (strain ATCC BAA-8 / DSM 12333 / CCUG 43141 / JCM 11478 / NBRC 16432 / NCIMB 13614 / HKI 0122) TaxID=471853 RepID=C5C5X6_BEUC1|nr:DUF6510 family protein [Beutenbergia cavernae]ACQ82334.1 hypothetical protein Bcav_4093 [Beutenbergia cavernae DSM 12333]